jgi:hypothetical protein
LADDVRLGPGDGSVDGCEAGRAADPIRALVSWTNDVIALQRASYVFPSIEAVIDDRERSCRLCCGSPDNAAEVFRYLEEHAEEMCLLPRMSLGRDSVYVTYCDFD